MLVKFKTVEDIPRFVNAVSALPFDINIADGSRVVDAKSLFGIMNFDLSKQLNVTCATDEEMELKGKIGWLLL